MKFNEKLIELRKKQGLSQEELGYKLNVTRQTVSKWELGETTPEMSKLSELSKIFGVTVDSLLSDGDVVSINVNETTQIPNESIFNNKDKVKNNKMLFIILGIVVLLVIIVGIFVIRDKSAKKSMNDFNKAGNGISGEFNNKSKQIINAGWKFFKEMNKNNDKKENEMKNELKETYENLKDDFDEEIQQDKNNAMKEHIMLVLEMYKGTQVGINVRYVIDEVITNNKKYKDQVITVIYQGKSITEPKEIQKLKPNFDDMTKYEVSYEYNDHGQIYQMEISE